MAWKSEDYDWDADDAEIERIQQRFPHLQLPRISTMRGWFPIVERWCEDVSAKAEEGSVRVAQIKAKFATLCIYTGAMPDDRQLRHDIEVITALAECRAARACEVCGAPGVHRVRNGYWHMLRCDEHADGGVPAPSWRVPEIMEIYGRRYRYDEAADALVEVSG